MFDVDNHWVYGIEGGEPAPSLKLELRTAPEGSIYVALHRPYGTFRGRAFRAFPESLRILLNGGSIVFHSDQHVFRLVSDGTVTKVIGVSERDGSTVYQATFANRDVDELLEMVIRESESAAA